MARKNSLISVSVAENNVMTFSVEGVGSFNVDPATLSDDIRNVAMLHGLRQKVCDAAAMSKDDPDNTPEGKLAAMQSVADNIAAGDWSKRSGDGSGPVVGIIYLAFARWVGEQAAKAKKPEPTNDAIRAIYDGMSRSEQLALRSIPRVGEIVAEIKASRESKSSAVDASALLAGLGI